MIKAYIIGLLGLVYLLCSLQSCQPNVSIKTAQYAVNGQKLYGTHCQNCHGAKGEGLGKLYPPLTDKNFLVENRKKLACILKFGTNDTLLINGSTFSSTMPAQPQLTDIDIAYILTYITTRFSDQTEAFTLEEIQENLKNCQ